MAFLCEFYLLFSVANIAVNNLKIYLTFFLGKPRYNMGVKWECFLCDGDYRIGLTLIRRKKVVNASMSPPLRNTHIFTELIFVTLGKAHSACVNIPIHTYTKLHSHMRFRPLSCWGKNDLYFITVRFSLEWLKQQYFQSIRTY